VTNVAPLLSPIAEFERIDAQDRRTRLRRGLQCARGRSLARAKGSLKASVPRKRPPPPPVVVKDLSGRVLKVRDADSFKAKLDRAA
jgi:hypothetical protein